MSDPAGHRIVPPHTIFRVLILKPTMPHTNAQMPHSTSLLSPYTPLSPQPGLISKESLRDQMPHRRTQPREASPSPRSELSGGIRNCLVGQSEAGGWRLIHLQAVRQSGVGTVEGEAC